MSRKQIFDKLVLGILFAMIGLLASTYVLTTPEIALNRDEAALGYNAQLLAQSGVDEWGREWPLALESFGDFKLPGYSWLMSLVYTVYPTYSHTILRLPSFLAFLSLILAQYLWARRLHRHSLTGLFTATLLVASPVFIHYGQFAFESMVSLALFVHGAFLVLWKRARIPTVFGISMLGVSMFFYNSPLIILPFFAGLVLAWNGVFKLRSWILSASIIAVWIGVFTLLTPVLGQKEGITIFSDIQLVDAYPQYQSSLPAQLRPILGHRYGFYLTAIIENYVRSLDPRFAYFSGGSHPWHVLGTTAHLWPFMIPLVLMAVAGVLYTQLRDLPTRLRSGFATRPGIWLVGLLLISIGPAVITTDAPHATRSLLFFFLSIVLSGYSIEYCVARLESPKSGMLATMVLGMITLFAVMQGGWYAYRFQSQMPHESRREFHGGLAAALRPFLDSGEMVAVVDPDGYQYIHVAWDLEIPSHQYFETIVRQQPDQNGFRYGERILGVHFIAHAADPTEASHILSWNDSENSWQELTP